MGANWNLLAVPALIALNAFFVAAEYAVVAVRPAQVEAMRRAGWKRAAKAIARLRHTPADAIGAIQVGITMTNLLLGWIGEPAMSAALEALFGPAIAYAPRVLSAVSIAVSFLLVTLLTVVFSELLPKALTLRYLPAAALLTAVPVLGIQIALRPLVWLMNAMANLVSVPLGLGRVDAAEDRPQVTAEELRVLTTQAAADGILTSRERSMILNTLALGLRTARQIMVPRVRVTFLDLQQTMDENRQVMNEYLYSRLPLCDGGMDNVVGVVHTKEFLSAYHAEGDTKVLSLIARPPVFVPERVTLDNLLSTFHEKRSQLVFLVDEYGGVEGIVTLRDVLDELIGPAEPAEGTTAPTPVPARPASLLVPGDLPVHELAQRVGLDNWGASSSASTVGGLIVAELGHIPQHGEELELEGVRLRVLECDGRAVLSVEVHPPAPAA